MEPWQRVLESYQSVGPANPKKNENSTFMYQDTAGQPITKTWKEVTSGLNEIKFDKSELNTEDKFTMMVVAYESQRVTRAKNQFFMPMPPTIFINQLDFLSDMIKKREQERMPA